MSKRDVLISYFSIIIELHQVAKLNPFLFTRVTDALIRAIHDKIPRCMLFIDDIDLVDEM